MHGDQRESGPEASPDSGTERTQLLAGLAHMLNEMRLQGTFGPAAFEELVARSAPGTDPKRP